jgi:hypothetical protein
LEGKRTGHRSRAYTKETFSPLNPDASLEAQELRAVGTRVGANLTPETVAHPGRRFTVPFMLLLNGAPLGAIAFVDTQARPPLLTPQLATPWPVWLTILPVSDHALLKTTYEETEAAKCLL